MGSRSALSRLLLPADPATNFDAATKQYIDTLLAGKQDSDADLTAIAGLSPANNDIVQRISGAWTNRTMAQLKTSLSLVKGDVGLGNVDNTSDANKPVSTATQTALNGKQPLESATAQWDTQNASGTTTSTSYTATLSGGTAAAVVFTAALSGRALLTWAAQLSHSASSYAYTSVEVRTGGTIGSGTVVRAASDDDANLRYGAGADRQSVSEGLTGLTAGNTYNARMLHRVDSGTGSFGRRKIGVVPTL